MTGSLFMLTGVEDLPAFAFIMEDESFDLDSGELEELARRREMVGDTGITAFAMSGTPYGMLVRKYAGLETAVSLYHDAPEASRDLFAEMERNYFYQFKLATECDVDVLVGIDDTSTTTISPAMFEELCIDYTNNLVGDVHNGGKFYWHHSCGLIHDLLHLYKQTRMDAVHAFMIPPIGDVTVAEGRDLLGNKIR